MKLEELIAIDTQNPAGNTDYTGMIELLAGELEMNGAHVRVVDNNLVASWGTPRLLLNAHMDTVKANGSWKATPPLIARVKNDKTFGLGAADNKGNIHCILKAIEKTPPQNLMVLFSADEEYGKISGAKRFMKHSLSRKLIRTVVMEPTENKVITKHPGYYSFWIEFKAKAQHSSLGSGKNCRNQENAKSAAKSTIKSTTKSTTKSVIKNAIIDAAHAVLDLEARGFNIGKIHSGNTAANTVASECSIKVSIRTYDAPEKVLSKIRFVEGLERAKISPSFVGLPFINKKPFMKSDEEVGFWSEASVFTGAGINTVLYGAGSIKQAHRPDEYVGHESLSRCIKFLQNMIRAYS